MQFGVLGGQYAARSSLDIARSSRTRVEASRSFSAARPHLHHATPRHQVQMSEIRVPFRSVSKQSELFDSHRSSPSTQLCPPRTDRDIHRDSTGFHAAGYKSKPFSHPTILSIDIKYPSSPLYSTPTQITPQQLSSITSRIHTTLNMSSMYDLLNLLAQPVNTPYFESPLTIGDSNGDHSQTGSVSRRHRGGDHWQALGAGPRLDIHETDSAYKATLEIPGCKK